MKLRQLTAIDIVNLVGIAVAANLAFILAQTVYRNYTLNRQMETLNGEIGVLKAQQERLKYTVQYEQTDSFRDREARSKLGLQAPGENVLVLSSPHQTTAPLAPAAPTPAPTRKSNFAQWLAFLQGNG